jgi:para-nitrobenzyl esterase
VTHTAEIPYAFNNLAANREWPEVDRKLADQMSSYWVNFATRGDPNGKDCPSGPHTRQGHGSRHDPGPTVEPESASDTTRWALYDALGQAKRAHGERIKVRKVKGQRSKVRSKVKVRTIVSAIL